MLVTFQTKPFQTDAKFVALLLFRPARNSRSFSRAFREKPEFYDENPHRAAITKLRIVGMGFSHVTIHALDRACVVTLKLQYRLPRNSRCFSRLFREKPEFYGENPIARR